MRARIGIFGGTFDPPHIEHLLAATEVHHELCLDRVLLVVANRPWQKISSRPITDADIRMEMVSAAVEDLAGLQASDVEIRRGGDSYTIDTVDELHRIDPRAELFVIVGADVESLLPSWRAIERLRASAHLVVVTREGIGAGSGPEDDAGWQSVTRLAIHRLDVSGTELRARVATGRNISVLCPASVVAIIERDGLYRVGDP